MGTPYRAVKVVITIDVDSGQVDSVKDENGNTIPQLGSWAEGVPEPLGGPREVLKVHWHHHSPGCITIPIAGGGVYQACFP